jgi:hypothetical protein
MQSPETRIVVRFWEKLRFLKNPPTKMPKPILFSLFCLIVYTSLAFLTVPTTCNPVDDCEEGTNTGTILIRPFIGANELHNCSPRATTEFPNRVPISESLFKILERNNFETERVFGNDLSKWQVRVIITTNCDKQCTADKKPLQYKKEFTRFNVDYTIVRINTSGTPGFAIQLIDVPVSDPIRNITRSMVVSVGMREPCKSHVDFCQCNSVDAKYANLYGVVGASRSDIVDGSEIRVELEGPGSADDACNCQ